MDEISTIATIITTVSIAIGVVFALLELRHLAETRKTEIIMRIYDKFGSREIVEAMNKVGGAKFETLQDYREKYGFTDAVEIAVLFEGIGVLLEQNLIDIKMVDQLFGPSVNSLWERMQPLIYAMRKGLNEPFFFSHFEYLINRLGAYRKR
jgi:DNA-binding ferritin-like protein (Dps family)